MKCHTHNFEDAVATCSSGCGWGRCQECATMRNPPTCRICTEAMLDHHLYDQLYEIAEIKRAMVINAIILASAILGTIFSYYINASGNQDNGGLLILSLLTYIPCIYWGWNTFKGLIDKAQDASGCLFIFNMQGGCVMFFFGAIICAGFAPIVIPFQLFKQWQELRELQGY